MARTLLKDERGFTLIEMLVVLTITMVICSTVFFYSQEKLLERTVFQTMNEVELLMRVAQTHAIDNRPVYFEVQNRNEITLRYFDQDNYFYKQKLPEGMTLYLQTPNPRIHFRGNGNIASFGGMTYFYKGMSYRYTVNIGKGRILNGGMVSE